MTAKELKEKAFLPMYFNAEGNIIGQYMYTEEQMQAFCKQLCQEQKEKCYDNFTGLEGANDILNAPMPEL